MPTRRVFLLNSLVWTAALLSALESYTMAGEQGPTEQEGIPPRRFSPKYMSVTIGGEVGSVAIIFDDSMITLRSFSPEGSESSCQLESSLALKHLWASRPLEATAQEIHELRNKLLLLVAELVEVNSVPDGTRILTLLRPGYSPSGSLTTYPCCIPYEELSLPGSLAPCSDRLKYNQDG